MNEKAKRGIVDAVPALTNVQNEALRGRSTVPKLWHQMIASGTGAILTSLFMTPFDVVKIRLQVQAKPMASGQCFIYCNGLMDHVCTCLNGNGKPWYKAPGYFNGTVDAMMKISKNEGLTRLWSGLPPTLLMAVPATVLYYTTYDQLRLHFLQTFSTEKKMFAPVLAGGISRVFAVSIINPLELIRTKMQSKPLSYSELVGCIKTAVEVDGFLSLWRGLGPTLLRDVPFSAIHWFFYDVFQRNLHKYLERDVPTFSGAFICGASSGTIASILTQPFDVIKTQRQVELGDATAMKNSKVRMQTSADVMMNIYATTGTRGLFAGLLPRIFKAAPACAIMISTFEYGKKFLSKEV